MKKEPNTVYVAMSADLLHPGHLIIIREAQKLGRVTLGLLTDEAIASYKRLPYLSYAQRKAVMENVLGIHEIIPQTTLDYRPNLKKVKPRYVVHGDDWKVGVQRQVRKQVMETLQEWGGEVIDVPRDVPYGEGVELTSSTALNLALKEVGTTPQMRIARLRRLIDAKPIVRGIEVHNGLTGLIAEHTKVTKKNVVREFDFMWLSSLTDSTAKGKPDNEVVDLTSRSATIQDVVEVTTKPIIFDGDTGGQIDHFTYNVRTLERLGVGAVIIEDKKGLKANSLFDDTSKQQQETAKAFAEKIKAGKQAQITDDFMIIARLESCILGKGVDDALKRAKVYIKAGVDGIMIHSKEKTPHEILAFCKEYQKFPNRVPLVAVPSTYSQITEEELIKAGVNVVIYANHLIRSAYPAMVKTAESILKNERAKEASDKNCMPIKEILTLIEKH